IDASAEPVAVFVGFAVVVVGAAGVGVGALVACLVGSCGGGDVVHAANTRTTSNTGTNRIVLIAEYSPPSSVRYALSRHGTQRLIANRLPSRRISTAPGPAKCAGTTSSLLSAARSNRR